MVIGIIGILLGIVTTAASSSVKMSRSRRADALCAIVQSGLAVYNAQEGEWPISGLEDKSSRNQSGSNNTTESLVYELNGGEVRDCVKALVEKTRQNNPVMDISGLFVSRFQGERNSGEAYGLDFMSAIRGTRKSSKKMKLAEMYFGYPESKHGWFRRFKIVYAIGSDSLTVTKQDDDDR